VVLEILIGIYLGLMIFLGWQGFNILPLMIISLLAGVGTFFAQKKGLIALDLGQKEKVTEKIITFEHIGGQDSAINELKEALDFLANLDEIKLMGIRPLKGILLTGPPGTGKTLLAKAAASYTDSSFMAVSGSDFVEMYAGVGAQRVRQLFKKARKTAKSAGKHSAIVFVDEIEVLGGKRGRVSNQVEYDQTLNQLLVEMDGLDSNQDILVLVVGATNRPDMLDSALIRPGRFDRQVPVDLPDKKGRLAILQIHAKNKPLHYEVSLDEIAKESYGFSGAMLESLTNEAAIYALRDASKVITQAHLRCAADKVILGERQNRHVTKEERRRIAHHEIGHALISELTRPGSVATVTVVPRGKTMGYMRQHPIHEIFLRTAEELNQQICTFLAGAIAEEIFFGSRSTGAKNDFQQAVATAREMIFAGLSLLGIVDEETVPQQKIHETIQEIISWQENRVKQMLNAYTPIVTEVAQRLLDEETLSGEDFRAALGTNVLGARKYGYMAGMGMSYSDVDTTGKPE
jgi:vesicle-fusing ATPase